MKKYLITTFLVLTTTQAFADGSPCEDTGKLIGNLEHKKHESRLSQPERGILASSYQTFYMSGCSDLQKYSVNGEKLKSKTEVR